MLTFLSTNAYGVDAVTRQKIDEILEEASRKALEPYLPYIYGFLIVLAIALIVDIIMIVFYFRLCGDVRKIQRNLCAPFQNKRPDYPLKYIELMQSILSAQQVSSSNIKDLSDKLNYSGGNKLGIYENEAPTATETEMIKLLKEQNELLKKLSGTNSPRMVEDKV